MDRNQRPGRPSVLLVDDRPEKLMTIEIALEGLDVNLVRASSGEEALRAVLRDQFAAILLDVRMPGMDGFETAHLIRQRKRSERTPIIFMTAYSDDTHVSRGYSLGAVDYIVAPIMPEVLRTKVSVFVDLDNALRQVREHAQAIEQRANQLQRLSRASLAIHAATSVEAILRTTTDSALDVIQSSWCLAGVLDGDGKAAVVGLAAPPESTWPDERATHGIVTVLAREATAVEPVQWVAIEDLGSSPDGSGQPGIGPVAGLLASLHRHDGSRMGVLFCAASPAMDFADHDRAMLLQLAQMCATAIENLLFSQAQEANRLKEEFLSTVSHELRTPLTAIAAWVKLLQQEKLDAKSSSRALSVIERNVKVQSKLIDDLLDISRIAAGKLGLAMKPVAIDELLAAIVETARPLSDPKELEIGYHSAGEARLVSGDPDRLQQVIWNLLTNSIKFTPKGGSIRVDVEFRRRDVEIRIADTGQGIAAEFLPHVFERFRQADSGSARTHGGLGIGLSVVRHLVGLHGGTVHATSPGPDCGATFVVRLPLLPERVSSTPMRSSFGGAPLRGIRVLAVNDESAIRQLICDTLSREGVEVLAVASTREALDNLEAFSPDVLVSDIGMPDEDGSNLVHIVRKRFPDRAIGAIALTTNGSTADRDRSAAAGFEIHLAKPIEQHELLRAVAQSAATPQPPVVGFA